MLRTSTAVTLLAALAGSALGQSFNIELGASAGAASGTVPASFAACGHAGHWNNVYPESPSGILLRDLSNTLTPVIMTRPTGQNAVIPAGNTDTGTFRDVMADGIPVNPALAHDVYAFSGLQPGRYLAYIYFANSPSGSDALGDVENQLGQSLFVSGANLPNKFRAGNNYSVAMGDTGPGGTLNVRAFRLNSGPAVVSAIQLVRYDDRVRVYVNDNATGDRSGTSWQNAMPTLREAMDVADSLYLVLDPQDEQARMDVWVAGGEYYPTDSLDRAESFVVHSGMRLYGGFIGTETGVDQRPERPAIASVLSGEIGVSWSLDNSRTIMLLDQCGPSTVVDGFTFEGGHDDEPGVGLLMGRGGAMELLAGEPTVRRCVFQDNYATRGGGAVFASGAASRFEGCEFLGNSVGVSGAGDGGAIWTTSGEVSILGSTFRGNSAVSKGGALFASGGAGLDVVNSRFIGNSGSGGSALYFDGPPSDFTNTLIAGNSGGFNTSALYARGESADVWLSNCTVAHNQAVGSSDAGITLANGSDALVFNSIIWGNGSPGVDFPADQQIHIVNGPTTITYAYSTVQYGDQVVFPMPLTPGNSLADPGFIDPNGGDNVLGNEDDNYRLASWSPAIDTGDNSYAARDPFDLDGDGQIWEEVPYDLDGNARVRDIPGIGAAGFNTIDRGAYESQPTPCGIADLNGDGLLDLSDVTAFIQAFQAHQPPADLAAPFGVYDLADINTFVVAFLDGCP